MEQGNTNWSQSVTGVVIKDGKVLLGRHTYGNGKGKLIVPGGYVNHGESVDDALIREFLEETKITVEPEKVIAIRFNEREWYVAFLAKYISGEASSDGDENSEVLWMDVEEVLQREDVPDLSKKLIQCAIQDGGLEVIPYVGNPKNGKGFLYGIGDRE